MSSNFIKIIACISMVIDHIGVILMPGNIVLRIIGRIAMPLFAYLIAQGLKHTSSKTAYMKRLLVFGLISQAAYILGFRIIRLNILFTFLLAVLTVELIERAWRTGKLQYKLIAGIVYACIFLIMDGKLMDYGRLVLYLVTCFYFFNSRRSIVLTMFFAEMFYMFMNFNIQFCMIFSLPIIIMYNGEKGNLKLPRYIFYFFYPVHMVLLKIIGMAVRL